MDVNGVEIGKQLHSLAVNSLQRGVECGLFRQFTSVPSACTDTSSYDNFANNFNQHDDNDDDTSLPLLSHIEFLHGNALVERPTRHDNNISTSNSHTVNTSIESLLSRANILFAYSTVFETNTITPYNPQLQAMILAPKWSRTLAQLCPRGCVAITTDRALNPEDGWRFLDRIEVENLDVWGSVGYISVLEK